MAAARAPAGADLPRIEIASAVDLHDFLKSNHAGSGSVWIVTWRKGDPRHVPRADLLRALLAWGWIDSLPRKLDEARTMLLISPRRPGSGWSAVNRRIVAGLEAAGEMRPPGARAVAAAKADGSWDRLDAVERLEVPRDLRAALAAEPGAAGNWARFPPSSRRGILEWIAAARRPETRARRVAETAAKAGRNLKANHPAGRDRGPDKGRG